MEHKSDSALLTIGLKQSLHIAQLFFKTEIGEVAMVLAKVVDVIIAAEIVNKAIDLLNKFSEENE